MTMDGRGFSVKLLLTFLLVVILFGVMMTDYNSIPRSLASANTSPTNIDLNNTMIAENVVAGTSVGLLSATDPDIGDAFVYTLVAGSGDTDNANFVINGAILKTVALPDYESKSVESIRIQVSDQAGGTFERVFSIQISNVNEPPTPTNTTHTINEDEILTCTLADFPYSDPENDALTKVKITSIPVNGKLQLNGTDVTLNQEIIRANILSGLLTFTPVTNASGASYATIGFRVSDGNFLSPMTRNLVVQVNPVNDPPTAQGSTITTLEDTDITINASLFSSYNDIENIPMSAVKITALPLKGSLKLDGIPVSTEQVITVSNLTSGLLKFSPALNGNGISYASISFKVSDGVDYSILDQVIVMNVTPVNDLPNASNQSVTTNEDTTVSFSLNSFGYTDIDGNALNKLKITALPAKGNLQLSGVDTILNQEITAADISGGKLKFIPVANEFGNTYTMFSFKVNDGSAYSTSAFVMTIDVTAVNDAPTAENISVNTLEDISKVITTPLIKFSDIENDQLAKIKITSLPSPSVGKLQRNGVDVTVAQEISRADLDGSLLVYTPAANGNGTPYTTFTYQVSDGQLYSSISYSVTINVGPVNDLPTSTNDSITILEDMTYPLRTTSFRYHDIENTPLSKVKITQLPQVGKLLLVANDVQLNQEITKADIDAGLLTYVPVSNAFGFSYDNIMFQVSDGTGYSLISYKTSFNVTSVSEPPTATNGTITLIEDQTKAFSVSDLGYEDLDLDPLVHVQITSLPKAGKLQVDGIDVLVNQLITKSSIDSGKFQFIPAANGTGIPYATFSFKVYDGQYYSDLMYTLTVNVTPVNDPPTATDGYFEIMEDIKTKVTFDKFNYLDVENDAFTTVKITSLPSFGILQLNSKPVTMNQEISLIDIIAGKLVYAPAMNKYGNPYSSFGFKVFDGKEYSVSNYTMTIVVTSVNDAPSSANQSMMMDIDKSIVLTSKSFSFSDVDKDTLAKVKITSKSKGKLQLNSIDVTNQQEITLADLDAGKLVYTPLAKELGTPYATIGFQVSDGNLYSNLPEYLFTINVVDMNDPPVANDLNVAVVEDTLKKNVFLSATDAEKSPLTYSIVTQSGKGVVVITDVKTGAYTYTPNANENGSDTFTFLANDGVSDSNIATVHVSIQAVNDIPLASSGTLDVEINGSKSGQLIGTDVDGNPLTFKIVSPATKGLVTLNPTTGAFSYQTSSNLPGSDSFTFKGNDGTLDSIVATVNITIHVPNKVPVAENIIMKMVLERGLTKKATLKAEDLDKSPLTFSIVTPPTDGQVVITNSSTGEFTYTAKADATKNDVFYFKVNDGTDDSNVAQVEVWIKPKNYLPITSDGTFSLLEDGELLNHMIASDKDGDPLTFYVYKSPELGNVDITSQSSGEFKYKPGANRNGKDTFQFIVNDGYEESNVSKVTFTISEVNDAPIAHDSTIQVKQNVSKADVLHAEDVDLDKLSYVIVTKPTKGNVSIKNAALAQFLYVAGSTANGTDTFTFKANDGKVDSNIATVTIQIEAPPVPPFIPYTPEEPTPIVPNEKPTAEDQQFTIAEDQSLKTTLKAADPEGASITYRITEQPRHGKVEITNKQTGTLTYIPDVDVNGEDRFKFVASDGNQDSNEAQITITISPVDDAPVMSEIKPINDPIGQKVLTIPFAQLFDHSNAKSADQKPIGFILQNIENGQLKKNGKPVEPGKTKISAGDTLQWTAPLKTYGNVKAFTLLASDDSKNSSSPVSVAIDRKKSNHAPIVQELQLQVSSGKSVDANIVASDSDGDPLQYQMVVGPHKGNVLLNPHSGALKYASTGPKGADQFRVRISDGEDELMMNVTVQVGPASEFPMLLPEPTMLQIAPGAEVSGKIQADMAKPELIEYVVSMPAKFGNLEVNSKTGVYHYVPKEGFSGRDQFAIVAMHGDAKSDPQVIHVEIKNTPQVHKAIMKSYPDGTFKPEQPVSRSELADTIIKVTSIPKLKPSVPRFQDVPKSSANYAAIETVSAYSWIHGGSHHQFNPTKPISRKEMIYILLRLEKAGFLKMDTKQIQKTKISWLIRRDLKKMQTFDYVWQWVTRKEVAIIFNRILKRGPVLGVKKSPWKDVTLKNPAFSDLYEAAVSHRGLIQPMKETIIKK